MLNRYDPTLNIRPATRADTHLLARLIRELAEYEKLLDQCFVTPEGLEEQLFGARPAAEAVIGEIDGEPQGMAIFFTTFSTFEAKPGLWLEDLYVTPSARGKGLGKALLMHVAGIAEARGYARLEWAVLDWNEPAIGFYRRLGAVAMTEWTTNRLDKSAIAQLVRR